MFIKKVLYIEWDDIPENKKDDYFIEQIAYAGDSVWRELVNLAKDQGYDSTDLECLDYIEII